MKIDVDESDLREAIKALRSCGTLIWTGSIPPTVESVKAKVNATQPYRDIAARLEATMKGGLE